MADVPQEPDKETEDFRRKQAELKARRDKIREERAALRANRYLPLTVAGLAVAMALAILFTTLHEQYVLERARIDLAADKQRTELDLQAKRLEIEREQVMIQRRNEALRHLAAVLEGAGTQAEKQRSFQVLLTFYISIDVLPKSAEKLVDWVALGARAVGTLLAALKDTKPGAECVQCGCCCATPPRKSAPRKPAPECK